MKKRIATVYTLFALCIAAAWLYAATGDPKLETAGIVRGSTKTVLTTAQVNAIETTPIDLVAAQGSGTWIEVIRVSIKYTFVANSGV